MLPGKMQNNDDSWTRSRYRTIAIQKLSEPLKPWAPWHETVSSKENARAYSDLRRFLEKATKLYAKAKVYTIGGGMPFHDSNPAYLKRLLAVECALREERWDVACHELYDLVYSFCIQDRRILGTIINMLERYL